MFFVTLNPIPIRLMLNKLKAKLHPYCKIETTVINGKLEGHLATCPYRIKLSAAGFQASKQAASVDAVGHDADDFD